MSFGLMPKPFAGKELSVIVRLRQLPFFGRRLLDIRLGCSRQTCPTREKPSSRLPTLRRQLLMDPDALHQNVSYN